MILHLDFLVWQSSLNISRDLDGVQKIFDPVRKKNVVLTPEELLRQLALQYLLQAKKYPPPRIRTEVGIEVNGMRRRCDILVYDKAVMPWLLVECKSPKIKLDQSAMDQAIRYNMTLNAPYVAVTNGIQTCVCRLNFEEHSWTYLDDFPEFFV